LNLATDILLACAAGLTLAWLVAAQRRRVARAARRFVSLPRVEQALLVLAVGVMTVCAQKSGTNEVVNAEGGVFNAEITELGRRGDEVATQSGSGLQTASTF
jgi:ABC-type Fe3+ transport system permease subunit